MGVRPGHLRIQSSGENDGSFRAEVFVVEPLGDMNIVTIQMEDLRFQVLAPPNYRSTSGVPVRISADSQQVLLFDGKLAVQSNYAAVPFGVCQPKVYEV